MVARHPVTKCYYVSRTVFLGVVKAKAEDWRKKSPARHAEEHATFEAVAQS